MTQTSVWTAYAWPARASPAAPLLRLVPVCENSFTGPPPAVSSTGSAHHAGTSNVSLAAALGPPRACQTFTVQQQPAECNAGKEQTDSSTDKWQLAVGETRQSAFELRDALRRSPSSKTAPLPPILCASGESARLGRPSSDRCKL